MPQRSKGSAMDWKSAAGLLCLAGVAAAAWWYREALGLPGADRSAAAVPSAAEAGLRKCQAAGRVLYTNGSCPAGSREQGVEGGTVSVVAAPRMAPAPAAAASRLPNVRDLLQGDAGVDIKERRMEEVIGR